MADRSDSPNALNPPQPRTGQAPPTLDRTAFRERFLQDFVDPRFAAEAPGALDQIEAIAWRNYDEGRKAPRTRKAGPGYADPDYDLSVDWLEAKARIDAAAQRWADTTAPSRALLVCGSSRNDGTCPGEMSKSWRLLQAARAPLENAGVEVDVLDLSRITSDYARHIHPCKGCVSTAMPLCHWPCSCYPNHGMRQTGDWMNEIYERWTAAHGVMIVTPVYWYQSPSPLKLMIDRLVCADGGNPDPTLTHGKKATEAKALELAGWDYPKHLAGRAYALAVHGDVAGIEMTRRGLSDWLDWMGLIDAGPSARLDRSSATTKATPTATRRWTATPPCRPKCAAPHRRSRWLSPSCAPVGYGSPMPTSRGHAPSKFWSNSALALIQQALAAMYLIVHCFTMVFVWLRRAGLDLAMV